MYPSLGWVTIRSQMHGKVLDVFGGRSQEGTKVIVWPEKPPPANNQKWRFEACGDGWYHIVSALHPNLVLGVEGGTARDCVPLNVYQRKSPPELNQMFRLNGNRLESALRGGKVLDIEGASRADGVNVILFSQKPARDAVNQAFVLQQVDGSWRAPLVFDRMGIWVAIRSEMHGKVLDAEAGRAKAGTPVILWQQNYTAHQKWRFERCEGIDWYHVVSALNSNLVLDVKYGDARPGAPIILWDRQFPAKMNQLFRMRGNCIESALGGKLVLDVEDETNGAKLIVLPEKSTGDRSGQAFLLQTI